MATKFSATGTRLEGILQSVRALLPEVSPSQQKNTKVSLRLMDAETAGGEKQKYQKKQSSFTRSTAADVCAVITLSQIPQDWQDTAVSLRRDHGIRAGNKEQSI